MRWKGKTRPNFIPLTKNRSYTDDNCCYKRFPRKSNDGDWKSNFELSIILFLLYLWLRNFDIENVLSFLFPFFSSNINANKNTFLASLMCANHLPRYRWRWLFNNHTPGNCASFSAIISINFFFSDRASSREIMIKKETYVTIYEPKG